MNIFKRQYNFLHLCTKSHKIQKRVNNNYWYYCYYYYLYFLFSERNFLLQNSKIIYDVKIKRNLYHWRSLETSMQVSFETLDFRWRPPDFHWRFLDFHWRPHDFYWRPQEFYRRPQDLHWRLLYFHWRPQIFVS